MSNTPETLGPGFTKQAAIEAAITGDGPFTAPDKPYVRLYFPQIEPSWTQAHQLAFTVSQLVDTWPIGIFQSYAPGDVIGGGQANDGDGKPVPYLDLHFPECGKWFRDEDTNELVKDPAIALKSLIGDPKFQGMAMALGISKVETSFGHSVKLAPQPVSGPEAAPQPDFLPKPGI